MSALFVTLVFAADPSALVAQAEADFDAGLRARSAGAPSADYFLAAAARYESLRRLGANNASLEHNIGNAYLLADDLPKAILAYRRGLRISPTHRALRANLEEARKFVVIPESGFGRQPEDRPIWLFSAPRMLFALAVVAYLGFWIALTRWLMVRGLRAWTFAILLLVIAIGLSVYWFVSRPDLGSPIVVVAKNGVLLRRGDGPSFPPRYDTPLNRGVEARILYRRGDWLQIELAGGEIGWVSDQDIVLEE